jgi:hypothetical protein
VRKIEHYAPLPLAEMASFMTLLRERDATAARALEFVILKAALGRFSAHGGTRSISRRKFWIVPAERMKSRKEHRVPLSMAAISLLEVLKSRWENDYVFPGGHRDIL